MKDIFGHFVTSSVLQKISFVTFFFFFLVDSMKNAKNAIR